MKRYRKWLFRTALALGLVSLALGLTATRPRFAKAQQPPANKRQFTQVVDFNTSAIGLAPGHFLRSCFTCRGNPQRDGTCSLSAKYVDLNGFTIKQTKQQVAVGKTACFDLRHIATGTQFRATVRLDATMEFLDLFNRPNPNARPPKASVQEVDEKSGETKSDRDEPGRARFESGPKG